uniref:RRM domain-containing protein n=1 Tax=Anopheles culicifacies TaxID=139723 RepID=A0A182MBZ4_9DIPT
MAIFKPPVPLVNTVDLITGRKVQPWHNMESKKGKKAKKNNKLSLGEFLTDGNTAVLNQVQVAVKRDWGDDCDDDDDDRVVRTQVIALPTAPRASRILNDDSVPQNPPYTIYVSNLPYDINEDDLYEIFDNVEIVSISLPRDDSETWRLRGFGNIQFATRDDLLTVLAMQEPMVRNRRIRIGLYNENDNKRRNNRYDNFSSGDSERPSSGGNWRDRPESASRPMMDRDRDRDGGGMRRPYSSGGYGRDREDRDRPSGDSGGGNWRTTDRPAPLSPRAPRNYDRDRDRDRDSSNGFRRGPDSRGPIGNGGMRREPDAPMERPKLVLQPRTLPLPELPKPRATDSDDDSERHGVGNNGKDDEPVDEPPKPKPTPVPAAKVFGDAKPVDTAAREREIEERLQQEELLRRKKEEAAAAEEKMKREAEKETLDAAAVDEAGEKPASAKPAANANRGNAEQQQPQPITNWRVRSVNEEEKGKASEERVLSPSRRFSPCGRYNSNRRTAGMYCGRA